MTKGLTTPSEINLGVLQLCNKIGNVEEPVFVNINPRDDSIGNECFIDVNNQIKEYGGKIKYGWILWIWDNIFAEATFHAVWENTNGQLLDVTLKKDNEKTILFAPDNNRKFDNMRVSSVRLPLQNNPKIKELIDSIDKFDEIYLSICHKLDYGSQFIPTQELIYLQNKIRLLKKELS